MKNKFLLSAVCAATLAMGMFSCQDAADDLKKGAPASEEVNLPIKYVGAANLADCKTKADIMYNLKNGELNWVKDTLYCLCGDVRVPATKQLNIAAGTTIRGQKASRASLTAVVGAKINATGTCALPIVFTSTQDAGSRARGDWGGVYLLGRARVNQPAPIRAEGFPNPINHPTSPAPTYGSNVDDFNAESSGTFSYVRIEFGGIPLPGVANSEKNGLTLAGVGSTTIIDHVQVSQGGDDGFEWFGGTVNAKYLISHKNLDDDFDTDFGYSGKVQFGVASRDPQGADVSGSNGFESDNDGTGSTATPRTSAIFSNFTVIGPVQCGDTFTGSALFNDGLHLRRRTGIDVRNTLVVGWKNRQVFADPASILATPAVAAPGDVVFLNNLAVRPFNIVPLPVVEPAAPNNVWSVSATNVSTTATVCAATNATAGGIYRLSGLSTTAWLTTAVNFAPQNIATSPILRQGMNANTVDPFFTVNSTSATEPTTYYIGARRAGSDDNGWNLSCGWVNWQPETASYPNDGDVNIL